MATITSLEVQKRNKQRVNIYVDGQFRCGMQAIAVLQNGLKVGQAVDEAKLLSVAFDSDVDTAFGKCIDLLARMLKTESQIKTYLSGKGYNSEVIGIVVEKLKGYHYIDDKRYAELYTEQNSKTKGKRRIKQELQQKGIERNTAEAIAEQLDVDSLKDNASALAEKYMKSKERDVKTLAKLSRYLVSRGYDYDTINGIVSRYKGNDTDDWD